MQVQNIDNRHELLHSGQVDAHRPPINQTCMGQCFKIYCTAFKAAVCKAALGCACITSQFTIWPLNVIGLQARNWSLRKKINSMIGIRVMISMLRNYSLV